MKNDSYREYRKRFHSSDPNAGRLNTFNAIWREMADDGHCDAVFSMEYWRVFDEWLRSGPTPAIREFIQCRANLQAPE